MSILEFHARDLEQLAGKARLRRLIPRAGYDFSSNDYLALASTQALRSAVADALAGGVPIGSGGSRLLRGNHEEHEMLEAEAASFFGSVSALFFSSGYAANTALLATLPQREDLIVYDALVHASTHEGMRLSRAATVSARHNDPGAFEDEIGKWRQEGRKGRLWIAVESLYSMEGDFAPLEALVALADRCGAMLIIDEAHATGVFGPQGRGLAADLEGRENVITVRTCGKALGSEGALVCSDRVVRDFLINRGRAFIFSTAPSPLIAASVRAALRLVAEGTNLRARLRKLIDHAERQLAPLGARRTGSQILPLILRDDKLAMDVAAQLQGAGFDVRGIRPPTVPAGTARLRISVTLNVDEKAISDLSEAVAGAVR